MSALEFNDFQRQLFELYGAGRYAEARDMVRTHGDRFPEDAGTLAYLHVAFTSRAGDPETALHLLEETIDAGHWYSEQVMRESPSFQVFQGQPAFERLVEICLERCHAARAAARPQRIVERPQNTQPPFPLLLALHGNNTSARFTAPFWRPAVEQGWLLAALQSSQLIGQQNYVWDDRDLALSEVRQHLAELLAAGDADPGRVVVGGFSMGATTAAVAALRAEVDVQGFIAVGPWMEGIDLAALVEQARGRDLRGYLLVGEQDEGSYADTVALAGLMRDAGLACELEIIPGLGHDFPVDWLRYLEPALAFVTRSS